MDNSYDNVEKLNAGAADHEEDLLKHLAAVSPEIAKLIQSALKEGKQLVLDLTPEQLEKLKSDDLMKSKEAFKAILRNDDGRIESILNVKWEDIAKIDPAELADMATNIYMKVEMAAINEKLDGLQESVDRVMDELFSEKVGDTNSAVQSFREGLECKNPDTRKNMILKSIDTFTKASNRMKETIKADLAIIEKYDEQTSLKKIFDSHQYEQAKKADKRVKDGLYIIHVCTTLKNTAYKKINEFNSGKLVLEDYLHFMQQFDSQKQRLLYEYDEEEKTINGIWKTLCVDNVTEVQKLVSEKNETSDLKVNDNVQYAFNNETLEKVFVEQGVLYA